MPETNRRAAGHDNPAHRHGMATDAAALRRRLVVIDLDQPEPVAIAHHDANPVIKRLYWPLRRWDPQRRAWIIKPAGLRSLITDLREHGYEVDVWEHGEMTTLPATGRQP